MASWGLCYHFVLYACMCVCMLCACAQWLSNVSWHMTFFRIRSASAARLKFTCRVVGALGMRAQRWIRYMGHVEDHFERGQRGGHRRQIDRLTDWQTDWLAGWLTDTIAYAILSWPRLVVVEVGEWYKLNCGNWVKKLWHMCGLNKFIRPVMRVCVC